MKIRPRFKTLITLVKQIILQQIFTNDFPKEIQFTYSQQKRVYMMWKQRLCEVQPSVQAQGSRINHTVIIHQTKIISSVGDPDRASSSFQNQKVKTET